MPNHSREAQSDIPCFDSRSSDDGDSEFDVTDAIPISFDYNLAENCYEILKGDFESTMRGEDAIDGLYPLATVINGLKRHLTGLSVEGEEIVVTPYLCQNHSFYQHDSSTVK